MTKTTVSADGQTIIPKEVLDFLKLQAGDEIDFILEENGKVLIQPSRSNEVGEDEEEYDEDPEVSARMSALRAKLDRGEKIDIRDLAGILHRKGMQPVSIEEMDEAVKQYVARKVMDF